MARRSEEYARLHAGGGYTQALKVGKGFSGSERRAAKHGGGGTGMGNGSGRSSGWGTMNAYARHQELIRNYHRYHLNAKVPSSGAIEAKGSASLTDKEALRRQHRFVRDQEEDNRAHQAKGLEGAEADPSAWEVRMASKYYQLLFKEYALADLSRYREDKVGLRWRTEKDVVSGKGQFECGALRCQERENLHSYELNFRYKEAGDIKNELVKVRVCPQCARKLFRKKIEALRRQQKQQRQTEAERLKSRQEEEEEVAGDGWARGSGKSSAGERRKSDDTGGGTGRPNGMGASSRGGGSAPGEDSEEEEPEGHGLVRQAVAAAGGGGGGGSSANSSAKKRSRPSRWGDKVGSSSQEGTAAAAVKKDGSHDHGSGGASATGLGPSGAVGDEATRQAWAGELERDRTAEDEMDDYLSSLLL